MCEYKTFKKGDVSFYFIKVPKLYMIAHKEDKDYLILGKTAQELCNKRDSLVSGELEPELSFVNETPNAAFKNKLKVLGMGVEESISAVIPSEKEELKDLYIKSWGDNDDVLVLKYTPILKIREELMIDSEPDVVEKDIKEEVKEERTGLKKLISNIFR